MLTLTLGEDEPDAGVFVCANDHRSNSARLAAQDHEEFRHEPLCVNCNMPAVFLSNDIRCEAEDLIFDVGFSGDD